MNHSIIEINRNQKIVLSERKIGYGAHWTVYEVILKEPITIEKNKYSKIICKYPKGSADIIDQNLSIYYKIKESGLPTLKFLEKGLKKNTEQYSLLITENLNDNHFIFVSPNSVKEEKCFNLKELLLNYDINKTERYGESGKKYTGSDSELSLAKKKINKINNFNQFIEAMFLDIKRASKHNLSMHYDAYFFGVEKDTDEISLRYKIADFDGIVSVDNNSIDYSKYNIGTAYEAIQGFLNLFVIDEKINKYHKILEDRYHYIINQIN